MDPGPTEDDIAFSCLKRKMSRRGSRQNRSSGPTGPAANDGVDEVDETEYEEVNVGEAQEECQGWLG